VFRPVVLNPVLRRSNLLIVDPAYHQNLGDNLLAYGEFEFAICMGWSPARFRTCGIYQSWGMNKDCGDFSEFAKDTKQVWWHAGGNWRDLWGHKLHQSRLDSIVTMLNAGMTVVGMPQSYYYGIEATALADATRLSAKIYATVGYGVGKKKVLLAWRQLDSYQKAMEIYPFLTNVLSPDIAFSVGPLMGNDRPFTYPDKNSFDMILLLRTDRESTMKSYRSNDFVKLVLQKIGRPEITFKIVDWRDRMDFLKSVSSRAINHLEFDMDSRVASGILELLRRLLCYHREK